MRPDRTFIIAEAGVNHNGDMDLAFKLIDAAVEAKVDAIKFQTFKAESLVTESAQKADYQKKQLLNEKGGQLEMLKQLELSFEQFATLQDYCNQKGILFLSTAFDHSSLEFLHRRLALNVFKVPSGEITNSPLLLKYAQTGADIILSTGMSDLGEVEQALKVLAYGFINPTDPEPSRQALDSAYFCSAGKRALEERVTILHCTTEYPAPVDEINLNVMETLRSSFGLRVGYSDHSEGIVVPVAAVAMGACLIEKHFTLDNSLPGPDHMASLEPGALSEMVRNIRVVEKIKGDGRKGPSASEVNNRQVARKSLVAARAIEAGETFDGENVCIKRPGTGLSPTLFWELKGQKAQRSYRKDEIL